MADIQCPWMNLEMSRSSLTSWSFNTRYNTFIYNSLSMQHCRMKESVKSISCSSSVLYPWVYGPKLSFMCYEIVAIYRAIMHLSSTVIHSRSMFHVTRYDSFNVLSIPEQKEAQLATMVARTIYPVLYRTARWGALSRPAMCASVICIALFEIL